jgi:tyrosine-protein kinase Etk/Wzc
MGPVIDTNKNISLPEDESIDFKRYASLFISNWYWFAVALFISVTIAYGINRYSGEVFTVSSTLLIQDEKIGGGSSEMSNIIPGGDIFKSAQNLKNEIGILKSYSLNYKAMKELTQFQTEFISVGRRGIAEARLYDQCPFVVLVDSIETQPKSVNVTINILSKDNYRLELDGTNDLTETLKFGERFKKRGFDFRIRLKDSTGNLTSMNIFPRRYYFYFISPERLANIYRNKLNITPIDADATLVTLSVSGFVPSQEADYLNKLMDIYINSGMELKNTIAANTIQFINVQLNIISDSLSHAEKSLEDFKLSNSINDISKEGSLIQNRLERFENEKITVGLQKKYFDYLAEYLNTRNESGEIISPSFMDISDPEVRKLVGDLALAQQQKKLFNFNYEGSLSAVGLIDDKIELARQSLKENIKNNLNNLEISLSDVNQRIAAVESDLRKLPGTERRMINIQRRYDLNNTVYTYLLEKRAEAGIAMASNVPSNRIIDRAATFNASRIKPKPRENYTIAFVLGLLFPLLGIFLIDYLNNKIIDKKDVEKGTKVPVLGFISHNDKNNELPVVSKPGSTLAESFRSVRTALKYYIKSPDHPVISVLSTISSEGKTFISMNLAAIISMTGKKVLLIGLDLRKPRIHKIFDVDNNLGISTYLSGNCNFEDIIKKTNVENLWYAPSGPVPPNPAELIDAEPMKEFLDKAKKEFDFIILDTPPVAVVTDALLLAPYVDVNLFIVRQRYSSKNTLGLIQELYEDKELKNLGIIINDISLTGYYGYGLRYGYSMGYAYGYNYYGAYSNRKYGYYTKSHDYYSD